MSLSFMFVPIKSASRLFVHHALEAPKNLGWLRSSRSPTADVFDIEREVTIFMFLGLRTGRFQLWDYLPAD